MRRWRRVRRWGTMRRGRRGRGVSAAETYQARAIIGVSWRWRRRRVVVADTKQATVIVALRGWRIRPVVIVIPSIPAGEKAQLLANRLRFCFRHSISGKDNRESERGVEESQATTNIKQEATHDRSGEWAMGR